MQEFCATTTVHHHAIRFKMDNKKHIVNLESFRDMLHICSRVHGQSFTEPPFKEEILAFIRFLGHSAAIRTLTDVNINKLYQPWRSFAAIINKCLTRKSSSYDSLRLSQAQILSNTKILRRAMRCIILGSRRLSSTISCQRIRPFQRGTRNFDAYKEYYAVATGAAPPKPKASVRKTKSSSDTTITPPTAAAGPRLTTFAKGKQAAKASKAKSLSALSEVAMTEAPLLKLVTKRSLQQTHISQPSGSGADEGTSSIPGVPDVPTNESEEELSWNSTDKEGDDKGKDGDGDEEDDGDDDDEDDDGEEGDDQEVERDDDKDDEEEGGDDEQEYDEEEYDEETKDEEPLDPIPKTPKNSDDEGNGEEDLGLNVGGDERHVEEEEEDELYKDVNINQGRGIQTTLEVKDSHVTLTLVNPDGQQQSSSVSSQFVTSMLNPTLEIGMESIFETTSQMDVQTPTSVAPLPMSAPTLTSSTIATITTTSQAPILPTIAPSTIIQDLPNFGSLFGFDMKVVVQIQPDCLRGEAQKENDEFLRTIDKNMKKIIKEQIKEQVKVQVSKILLKIEQIVNEQLEANVLTRSSHSSKTSYAVAADLSEMELKKILIKKMEGNKDVAMMMLIRMKNPSLDQTGGPRDTEKERSLKEPMQTTLRIEEPSHLEFDTGAEEQPIVQSSQHPEWFSQQQKPPSPDRDWNKTLPAIHESIQPWISELVKQTDSRSSFNELMDTPLDFSNFLINQLKVDTLTPELLAVPTYELMKGSCKSLVKLEYHLEEVFKATTDQLDWVNPEGQQYPHNLLKPLPLIPTNRSRRVISFEHFINNDLEYLRGGASRRKYTTFITKTKVANYRHLKDDDKLYKFKEGDFKRLRIQDIEDMLLLLVQGKLTNLTVVERFAFNVSLRMFTRSIVIQRRVEDLQLGFESYQKKLNLTKPDSYRSNLKHNEAYNAYSNPRGFIYQNKDKKNRLMRIDELHKFNDGTLIDVRTALDDRLKGIQIKYLP
nr:hypothetical protein [Tanacetum cinerariifolium]